MAPETPGKSSGKNGGVWIVMLREARLIGRLLLDKRVPWYLKLLPVGAAIYAISPVDLLPLNPLDDAALLSAAFYLFIELCPDGVVEEHRQAMKGVVSGQWRDAENEQPPSSDSSPH